MKLCTNKPKVIVDNGPWYAWDLQRLELEYEHQRFNMRNGVERFFRYLKKRIMVLHNKLSAREETM
ncbi:MAG: hypothetical protein QXP45_04020 [Thermoproteota archaeon]